MLGPPETENPPVAETTEGPNSSTRAGLNDKNNTVPIAEYRARRFATQRAIALTCRADALANFPNRFPGDVYRVVGCMWCRAGDVSIVRSVEFNRAHYKGLQTCGSVWMCPCCASKIEERRRLEIVQVFAWAAQQSLDSSLITNTFSHGQGDDLHDLFKRQAAALKSYRTSRTYTAEMKSIGYVSMVRSLEITHGQNGFHPHTHEVQFHRERLTESDARYLRAKLVVAWMSACTKAGLFDPETDDPGAFNHRAIDVRHRFTAGQYLAKQDDSKSWTPAHEIAKSSSKEGRRSGIHPFQLATRGNPGDPDLFMEYVRATKGKRKLFFSPGLKKKAGLHDVTDEQIAARIDDASSHLANLPPIVWDFIKSTDRQHNTRAGVLDAAEKNGQIGIAQLLQDLGFSPP